MLQYLFIAYRFVKQVSTHFLQTNPVVSEEDREFLYDEVRNVERPVFTVSIAAWEESAQRLSLPRGSAQPRLSLHQGAHLPLPRNVKARPDPAKTSVNEYLESVHHAPG